MVITGYLIKNLGHCFLSPIVHCHPLSEELSLRGDAAYWKRYNYSMLEMCDTLLILELPGHLDSVGIQWERLEAAKRNMLMLNLDVAECKAILETQYGEVQA
jgi:hypothetical protein